MVEKLKMPLAATLMVCALVLQASSQPPIRATAVISGVVSKNNGMLPMFTPIPGATVYREELLAIPVDPGPYAGIPAPIYAVIDSAIADKSGAYAMDSVVTGGGAFRLTYTAKGFQSRQIFANIFRDTVINMQLTALTNFYSLRGRTSWNCPYCGSALPSPIPGCTVTIRFPGTLQGPIHPIAFSTTTDSMGNYAIDSIPADSAAIMSDTVTVYAGKQGYIPDTFRLVLHAKKIDTLNFSLFKTTIRVRGPDRADNRVSSSLQYSGGKLYLTLAGNQSITINAFKLDGTSLGNILPNRFLNAGNHSILLDEKLNGSGVVLIQAIGTDFHEVLKIKTF
jgi:hypothetical protein